jgi:hypothetical protein
VTIAYIDAGETNTSMPHYNHTVIAFVTIGMGYMALNLKVHARVNVL